MFASGDLFCLSLLLLVVIQIDELDVHFKSVL